MYMCINIHMCVYHVYIYIYNTCNVYMVMIWLFTTASERNIGKRKRIEIDRSVAVSVFSIIHFSP